MRNRKLIQESDFDENEILEEYMMILHRLSNNIDEMSTIDEIEDVISDIENVLMDAETDEDISDEDFEELSDLANDLIDELYEEIFHIKKKDKSPR